MPIEFNVTKFCEFTGEYSEMSYVYMTTCKIIFSCIGFMIVTGNLFVFTTVMRHESFRRRRNVFLVSLILSDFFYGLVFMPLFVVELSSKQFRETCLIRPWRVIAFMYFFSIRFLSIFFISFYTYIRTCKTHTTLETTFNKYMHVINIIIVWLLTLVFIVIFVLLSIPADKVLATIVYTYFVVSIICIVVTYAMTLTAIKRAKKRSKTRTYTEAIDFVRWILIWFLSTNIPLALCGIALLIFAYKPDLKNAYIFVEHHIFIVCIAVASLDAVANPIVYLRKCKELREQLNHTFPACFKSKDDLSIPPVNEPQHHDVIRNHTGEVTDKKTALDLQTSFKNNAYEEEKTI